MTFLHKLARRLAGWPRFALPLLSLAACSQGESRDFLSPEPGLPTTIAAITVSPRVGSVQPNEAIRFTAAVLDSRGRAVTAEVDWSATGGTILSDGTFLSPANGLFSITARVRAQPQVADSAQVSVFSSPRDVLLITVTPDSALILENEALKLDATARLADGTVVTSPPLAWTATGGTVDGSGWFSAAKEGDYVVSARAADGVTGSGRVMVRGPKAVLLGLAINPEVATIGAGASLQFAVQGLWSDGSNRTPQVVWNSTGGTITSDGLFSAGSTAGTFRVYVRDKQGTLSDTAFVSVTEPVLVGLDLLPSSATLAPGATQQFTAVARLSDGSTREAGVSWQATGGTITGGGLYTAGGTDGTFRVIGAVTGTAWVDTASVVITSPVASVSQIIVNPGSATVPAGTQRQFSATAVWSDGSTTAAAVTWSATGGSISTSGLYTAGTAQGAFRVIAVGQGGGGGRADTSDVTVSAPILTQLVLNPGTVTVLPGGAQQFTASGLWSDGGTQAPAVTYAATGGTITAAGLYSAGTEPGTYRVIATQTGGTLADTSLVTIEIPPPVLLSLAVSPATASIQPGGSQQFTASGTWSNGGTAAPQVVWTAHGGTLTSSGLYTAGGNSGTFQVIASQVGGSLVDTALVTVASTAPVLVSLAVSPASTTLLPNGSRQFAVSGTWSDGSTGVPAVTWAATGGVVTNGGLYVAGSVPGAYRVVATQMGGGLADTAEVTVSEPPVLIVLNVEPDSAVAQVGGTVQFGATGTYSNGGTGTPSVVWSATGGTISSTGLFTAGANGGSFRVIAAQSSGGSLADTALTRVTSDAVVTGFTVSPDGVSLLPGATQQFTAAATWSDGVTRPITVTYTATGGTVTGNGLYTAGQVAGTFLLAASCSCGAADSTTIAVLSPPATLTAIAISPKAVSLPAGGTQQFSVVGTMSDGSTTTAQVTYSAQGGTISSSGLFTAGSIGGTFAVLAVELSGPRDSAFVTVDTATGLQPGVPELPRQYLNTDWTAPTGKQIVVAAGGNLQTAINQAQCGDEILLAAGSTYTGNFTLPAKGCSSWITIRTNTTLPPQGTRMTPVLAAGLAKIVTNNSTSPMTAASRASFYRLAGLEITATTAVASLNSLVWLHVDGLTDPANFPTNIILDRLYVHGHSTLNLSRCVLMNSASTAVVDSYLSECHGKGFDSQAIVGWAGPGPYKIVNNYLEGAGENVMFGGADPTIVDLVPSDIEIRGNHFFKPLSWLGVWTIKNLFEVKDGQRILVEANVFENNMLDAQTGFAIVLKSVNQNGKAPWSVAQDITFRNNLVLNAPQGLNIASVPDPNPAVPARRMLFRNNVFRQVGSDPNGALIQLLGSSQGGLTDIQFVHNTFIYSSGTGNSAIRLAGPLSSKLVVENNVLMLGSWGIKGDASAPGTSSLNNFWKPWSVRGNGFIGSAEVSAYPGGNAFVSALSSAGILSDGTLTATSPLRGKAVDGTDPGANIAEVTLATLNARSP